MENALLGTELKQVHFDRVALHMLVTLQELKITNEMINEFVALILPLRSQIESREQTLFTRLGGAPAIEAVVEGMYEKIF